MQNVDHQAHLFDSGNHEHHLDLDPLHLHVGEVRTAADRLLEEFPACLQDRVLERAGLISCAYHTREGKALPRGRSQGRQPADQHPESTR